MDTSTSIIWLPESDLILFVDDAEDIEGDGIVTGRVLPHEIILDLNRVNYPVSLKYFQKLWNNLYPEQMLTADQIVIENNGEHRRLGARKEAMPQLGLPAERKLYDVGKLGESLVSLIPGITEVEDVKSDGIHDVDLAITYNGQRYGVELKTNTRSNYDPYRYKLTGYGRYTLEQIRQFKTAYCQQLGLTPGTLGITIDFENSTFDACLLPGQIKSFLGGRKTVIAQDISFENTGVRPLNAEKSLEQRVPAPFTRPGETAQPAWKRKVAPPAPDPDEVFGPLNTRRLLSHRIRKNWYGAVMFDNGEMAIASNPDYTHDEVAYYDLGYKTVGNAFWRGLFDKKTGTLVHLSNPGKQIRSMEQVVQDALVNFDKFKKRWLDAAMENDILVYKFGVMDETRFDENGEQGLIYWEPPAETKTANILDPIHDELDQRVFDGIEPRYNLFEGHLTHMREVFRQNGFDHRAFDFYLTGSICTYQYSETSDCDITIVCNQEEFDERDRTDLVLIVTQELDGEHFPGTEYPFQHFVQPGGVDIHDLFRTGLRSAYSFSDMEWISPPDPNRVVDIQNEYPDWFAEAIQVSEKMNTMIDGGHYEDAFMYYKVIHDRRKEDQKLYGDISSGNVIYKFVVNNGTIDRLRNVGYHIAT